MINSLRFHRSQESSSCNTQTTIQLQDEYEQGKLDITDRLSHELGIEMITSIPCYCDIQFLRKEFLTVLRHPGNPFSKQIEQLIEAVSSPRRFENFSSRRGLVAYF